MDYIVCKFGGTSLASAKNIKKVAKIVLEDKKKFVVLSAPGKRNKFDTKITDCLISLYNKKKNGENWQQEFDFFKTRFNEIVANLGVSININKMFEDFALHINTLCEYDYVISRGEFFMAKIFAEFVGYSFLDASLFIVFNKFGEVDLPKSKLRFSSIVTSGESYVIPGFYGINFDGKIKAFSRGGSDITGAVVSVLANAKVYQNFTDVDGFLDADPKVCKNAKLIEKLSYSELRALSYTGANVLHPDCVKFLRENNIVLNLRNTFNPACKGSLIMPDKDFIHSKLLGMSGGQNYKLLKLCGFGIHANPSAFDFVTKFLDMSNAKPEHIFVGTDNICVVLKENAFKDELLPPLLKEFEDVKTFDNVSLISIVGKGLKNKELERKVINAIYDCKINVLALNKGGEGLSIIFAIENQNFVPTTCTLHDMLLQ